MARERSLVGIFLRFDFGNRDYLSNRILNENEHLIESSKAAAA